MDNIRDTVGSLSQAFETFKTANDKRFGMLESKKIDPLEDEKFSRIDQEVEDLTKKLGNLEIRLSRPDVTTQEGLAILIS